MAVAERPATDKKLAPILEAVAHGIGRSGIKRGEGSGPAVLNVTLEENIERVVRVYWTPFQAVIPGRSVGLHLDVAEPKAHWCEAYLSPERNCTWVFAFAERPDSGEVQLMHYRQCETWQEGVEAFFEIAGWYTLTATDKAWTDVTYTVAEKLSWPEHNETVAGEGTSAAITESLKKSTIMWLTYNHDGEEITRPVWFLYDSKANRTFVISGERQQILPGAESLRECVATLRWKGKNAAVAQIPASVTIIQPEDPDWTEVAEKLAEKRLNIPGLPEETARRWREECLILELHLRL